MENIAKAIINVMSAVKGIEKSMTVGNGSNSYKGVPDQEVKKIIGEAMEKNGLCMLPTGVTAKTEVSRWEETTVYNNTPSIKQKQSVFTEVTTKYLLLHTSGESIVLEGYGHGVDSQDKGAGKATTYALKYTLLYTFLIPTGKIDDADIIHSDTIESPKKVAEPKAELPVTPLTTNDLAVIEDNLRLINDTSELARFYKSLPKSTQSDSGVLKLLGNRKNELNQLEIA